MRYLPYGQSLAGVRHIQVGGHAHADGGLVLSNAPCAPTPPPLRAPTNAEIVLNLLRSSRRGPLLADVVGVTAERFDADLLLALWALLEPDAALAREAPVAETARAGAFRAWTTADAAKFLCWVNGIREVEAPADAAAAFRGMLPRVTALLDDVHAQDLYWIGEYGDISQSDALLHSGAVQLDEYPELDLVVIQTPLDLHDLVRFGATQRSRVLTVRSENTYVLEYRLESWVRTPPRTPLPRIDLRPLAARLNLFERRAGRWRSDPVDDRTPRLYLHGDDGRPMPSAVDAETVIAEVLDFLRLNAANRSLLWSPSIAAAASPSRLSTGQRAAE